MHARHPWRTHLLLGFLLAAFLAVVPAAQQFGPPPAQTEAVQPLKFQYMGPASAGRFSAVVGIPGDTTTYYAGAASGGIWKTIDSGKTFEPIFDDMPVQAIGALAIAPTDPNTIWAGTGEAW